MLGIFSAASAPRAFGRWIAGAGVVVLLQPLVAQCTTQWLPGDGMPGVGGIGFGGAAHAGIAWDADGPGPATPLLVVGGSFSTAGRVLANNIAAYDPATGQWSPLGAGLNGEVTAIAVLPSGELVAGWTSTVASVAVAQITKWDGATWSAVGALPGTPGWTTAVYDLAVLPNGDLVAAGLGLAGSTGPLARWDGSSWSAIGVFPGFFTPPSPPFPSLFWPNVVTALAVLPTGDLVVSGGFTSVSGVAASNIARWDGAQWWPLDSGLSASAAALCVASNGDLLAGGSFTTAGSVPVQHVARWDGTSWSPLGVGAPDPVLSLAFDANGDLLASDRLAVSPNTSRIHRWDGTAWTSFVSAPVSYFVAWIVQWPFGGVFVGGAFSEIAGVVADGVARWNGVGWSALSSGTGGDVGAFALAANGDVIAGGSFRSIEGTLANGIARWNGSSWTPLGTGLASGTVNAIACLSNGDVVAGGHFASIGGVAANNIARWDGLSWHPLGSGTDNDVRCLAVMRNGDLIVGGDFATAGSLSATAIARWNGTTWTAFPTLQGGGGTAVLDMDVVANGDLVACGRFSQAGAVVVNGIARWNGTSWLPLGSGGGSVWAWMTTLVAMPNGDIVASNVWPGGNPSLTRWNGFTWTPLPAGPLLQVGTVALLANGDLVAAGVQPYEGTVARWDGASWSTLGSGCNALPLAFAVLPSGDLWAGGYFTIADGQVSARLARWSTSCPSSSVAFGAGCVGSGGPNRLETMTPPWNGSTFRARATGLAASSVAVSAYGFGTTSVPWPTLHPAGVAGCNVLVADDILQLLVPIAGIADTAIFVAASPALVGAAFHHQVTSVELGSLSQIVAITSTNALSLVVGSY